MNKPLLYALFGLGAAGASVVKKYLDHRYDAITARAAIDALRDLDVDQAAALYAEKLLAKQEADKRADALSKIQAAVRQATRG